MSVNNYREAELSIIRQCQLQDFPEGVALLKVGKNVSIHSHLAKLAPEYDSKLDLIRVDSLSDEVLHPVVLSPNNHAVKPLIKHYDDKLHHPGASRVYAELRCKFWILQGREAIKRHQHSCLDCRKWCGKPVVPRITDLPPSSLRLFKPPFYSTAEDKDGASYRNASLL